MKREDLCRALSKIAWGYVFLYFNLNLGFGGHQVNVLPDWVYYVQVWGAILLLEGVLRDLKLLKTFCIFLGAVSCGSWLGAIFGVELPHALVLWSLLVTVAGLYFHFQMLTVLIQGIQSGLFGMGAAGAGLANRLRACRNIQALLQTATALLVFLWDVPQTGSVSVEGLVGALVVLLALAGIIMALVLVFALFKLRRCVREEELPWTKTTTK